MTYEFLFEDLKYFSRFYIDLKFVLYDMMIFD